MATLVSAMVLATLIGLIQSRSLANQRLAAALAANLREGFTRDAIFERLRGLIADQMIADAPRKDRPALNGTPFVVAQNGQRWHVKVQDTLALVDVYFSAPEIIELVLPDSRRFLAIRKAELSKLPAGNRFPNLSMSLARFELSAPDEYIFTQSSTSGQIRLGNTPKVLESKLMSLPPRLVISGQVQQVYVSIVLANE